MKPATMTLDSFMRALPDGHERTQSTSNTLFRSPQ
jgi:hypothetical protein